MPKKGSLLLIAISLCAYSVIKAQTIHTIAGNGATGFSGDGGLASAAQFNSPWGLTVDDTGNLFIADRNNNRIRKVSISGTISTIAGNGIAGYGGDGGAATAAQLNSPMGVTVDNAGNLYIADKDNHRIRKVSSGNISTIAGNGSAGYAGDGGPAAAAQLNNPRGVAIDATGNIYIADAGNHVVRMVDASGIITTVAGNGTVGFSGDGGAATAAQLHGPYHIAFDDANNLYIADVDNSRIRKVTPSGIISTVAGNGIASYSGDGGAATAASLQEPISLATDNAGNLYIADAWNARIRRVNPSGVIETIAGNGTPGYSGDGGRAVSAQLNNPYGIATKGTTLFVADNGNSRVRLINTAGSNSSTPLEQPSILVFPNPSHGEFTVQLNTAGYDLTRFDLIGIDGARNTTFTCIPNWPIVIRTNVPRGIYFIVAYDNGISPVALVIQ